MSKKPDEKINLQESVEVKIAVLGKSLVGKTALTYRFINDKFPTEHDTTIEDQYKINLNIEGIQCRLEILDTAGQDDYETMLDSWISYADGFLLIYSIDDKESFEALQRKYERVKRNKAGQDPQIIVIGNKCDLEEKRKISKNEVENICREWGVNCLEASALNKINVKESFLMVSKQLLERDGVFNKGGKGGDEKKKNCYCF